MSQLGELKIMLIHLAIITLGIEFNTREYNQNTSESLPM